MQSILVMSVGAIMTKNMKRKRRCNKYTRASCNLQNKIYAFFVGWDVAHPLITEGILFPWFEAGVDGNQHSQYCSLNLVPKIRIHI